MQPLTKMVAQAGPNEDPTRVSWRARRTPECPPSLPPSLPLPLSREGEIKGTVRASQAPPSLQEHDG